MNDPVNRPSHYNFSSLEPIDIILDRAMEFCLGNCFKYIARCQLKNSMVEDLNKAEWYFKRAKTSLMSSIPRNDISDDEIWNAWGLVNQPNHPRRRLLSLVLECQSVGIVTSEDISKFSWLKDAYINVCGV